MSAGRRTGRFFTMATLSDPRITFFIIFLSCLVLVVASSSEAEILLKVKNSLQNSDNNNNNALLPSWNTSTSPCSKDRANWRGVRCYLGQVYGLQLENMGLKGIIDVDSLKDLPFLRTISFMNNNFDGPWPEFNKIPGLKAIYLSNNKFSGLIPDKAFERMQRLKKIHLANNQFEGHIPASMALLSRLVELRLEGNKFMGVLPLLHTNELKSFSVANNHLHGQIPPHLQKMSVSAFSGNKGLCGTPLEECQNKKPSFVSTCIVLVAVVVAVVVIGAVILMLHRRRQRGPANSVENPPLKKGPVKDASDESNRSSRSISSTHSRKEQMKLCFVRDDREKFDLHELLKASAEILGSGCFSSSYKASLLNGPSIVVKRFKQMNNVGKEEFQEHMRRIGRLNHPNLLPLVAYYYRKEEKLLVADYVQNGSLAVRLHGHQALGEPSLDWPMRLKIVKGIATGLECLYKDMPSLIAPHGNLKSSNVLLTQSFEPLLNDYGLVPLINQDLAQDIMVAYKSPEYLQQGRITKKTDLWCLGILILEILTGKLPATFLQQGKGSEVSLANWVHSVVPEQWTSAVFDNEMGATENSEGEMVKLLKIALRCCEVDVDKRWDLKEAVEKIREVKERDHDGGEDFNASSSS